MQAPPIPGPSSVDNMTNFLKHLEGLVIPDGDVATWLTHADSVFSTILAKHRWRIISCTLAFHACGLWKATLILGFKRKIPKRSRKEL